MALRPYGLPDVGGHRMGDSKGTVSVKRQSNASLILREDLEKRWPGYVYSEYQFLTTRKFRFDFAVVHKRPFRLAFEINGSVWTQGRHTRGAGFVRDSEKRNLANLNHWRIFEWTPQQIEHMEHIAILDALARGE